MGKREGALPLVPQRATKPDALQKQKDTGELHEAEAHCPVHCYAPALENLLTADG